MESKFRTDYTGIYKNVYEDTDSRIRSWINLFWVWKGSVIKLLWQDLLAFVIIYFSLSILYWQVLFYDEASAQYFEMICIYCERGTTSIRTILIFLTGFYVTQVIGRYWDQFTSLAWADRIAFKLVATIPGTSMYHRTLRRTMIRYVNLSTILVLRLVASKVNERFPTYASLVKANVLLPHEKARLQTVDERTPHETTYIPILWALNLVHNARKDGKINIEAPVYANLISSIDYLESKNRSLFNHGWINFPLAYTQVATLANFFYFVACLFGRQYLYPRDSISPTVEFDAMNLTHAATFAVSGPYANHSPNLYFPFFTILEFLCFVGWIKVADELLNPFGDDDEDFQINYVIDRNLQVSYLIVDEAMTELEMLNDPFLEKTEDDIPPAELPYDNDDGSGCLDNIKEKMSCWRKNHHSGSTSRQSIQCQSAKSDLQNLTESQRSQSSKIVNGAPLEISVVNYDASSCPVTPARINQILG